MSSDRRGSVISTTSTGSGAVGPRSQSAIAGATAGYRASRKNSIAPSFTSEIDEEVEEDADSLTSSASSASRKRSLIGTLKRVGTKLGAGRTSASNSPGGGNGAGDGESRRASISSASSRVSRRPTAQELFGLGVSAGGNVDSASSGIDPSVSLDSINLAATTAGLTLSPDQLHVIVCRLGSNPPYSPESRLLEAVQLGDFDTVRLLAPVVATSGTALRRSASTADTAGSSDSPTRRNSNADEERLPNINHIFEGQYTVLDVAALSSHSDITHWLLDHGAMHAPTTLDNKIWFALLKAWVSETWNRFDTVIELMNKDEIIKIYRKLRLYERQIRHFESSVVASAPSSVSLTCLSNTSLLVTFAPPYSSGNALLTNYAVSWSASPFTPDSPFSNPAGSSEPTIKTVYVNGHSSTFVIEPLPENAITFVRVAARNIQGLSPWQLASPRCLQLSSWKAINLAKPVVDLDVTASAIKDAQDYFSDRAKRHRDVERVVMGGSSSKVKQMMGVVPDSSHVALKIAPGSDWVPQMKLERTLQPNGIYLASLVFCDENNSVLITAKDETWPIVTLDPAYVGKRQFDEAHDIFTWMARVGAQWNTLHTLLQGVDDFDGLYDSSRAQCEFVKAAAYLRHVLGVELGRLHFRPLTLPNRASVVVTVLRVAKTADISEDLPHKWQTVLPTSLSQPPSLHSSFTTDRNGTENGSDKVSTNSPRPSFIAPDLVSRTSSSDFSVENVQNFGLGAFLNQLNNVWGTNPVAVAPALYHERSSSTASAASVQAAIQHNEPVVSIAATKLHDYTEHLLAAHVSLTTPLRRGVYVAHVMPINRINRVDVVVPRTTPHIVPHSLVREGSSQISAEEWSTLRRVVRRETTLSELQDQLAQLQDAITPSSTIDHFVQISKLQAGIRFCQEVTRATAQLTMSVSSLTSTLTANGSNAHGPHTPTQPSGLSPNTSTERLVLSPDPSSIRSRLQDAATHTAGHRIYCGEPIEVSSQVTLILILPPESTLRHISQGGLADSERFISLPLAVFENVHFLQYQASIYRMYAKLSVIVHHDKALLNQWSRQGHSAMAKEKAAEELDLISSVDHDLELSWKNVRWVKQAVQLGLALGSSSHSASTSSSGNLFGSPISSVSSIAATAGSSSVPSADAKNELFPLLLPSLNLTLGTATSTVSVGSATSDSDSNI